MKRHKYGYLAITFCVFVVAVMVAAFTLYAGSLLGFSGSAGTGLAISTAVALLVGAWFVYVDTRVLWGTVPLWQFRDVMPRGVINRIDAIKTAMPEAEVLVHFCRIDPIIIVRHEQQQFCVAAWDMKQVLLPNVE